MCGPTLLLRVTLVNQVFEEDGQTWADVVNAVVLKYNQQTIGLPILSQPSIADNNCTIIKPPAGMVANKNTSYASVEGKSANNR